MHAHGVAVNMASGAGSGLGPLADMGHVSVNALVDSVQQTAQGCGGGR
jgi:hypothetical protein